jgi:hypothetical protein
MSMAACDASARTALSNARTDETYQNSVTALSGTTERRRKARISLVRNDIEGLQSGVYRDMLNGRVRRYRPASTRSVLR